MEGYSYDPRSTPDGKKLCYRILKGVSPISDSSELRVVELASGRNEACGGDNEPVRRREQGGENEEQIKDDPNGPPHIIGIEKH